MKERIILLAAFLMASISMSSQTDDHVQAPYPDEVNIGAVNVSRDGQTLIIGYTVRLGENVRWCRVGLYQSTDGGQTFSNISSAKHLSGDIGRLYEGGIKEIKYNISEVKEQLADKELVYKVEVVSKDVIKREYILAGVASVYPNLSYGIMIGTVKKTGFYLKARTNFKFVSSSYNCNGNGVLESGGKIWSNGIEERSRFVMTGGMLFHLNNRLYPYLGAGYGSKQLYLQDIQEKWANVTDLSYKGVSLEAGLLFKFNKMVVSTSVCNTAFKYTEGEIGFGFIF